uniref:kinesin-like protein KIF6 n=1 Tax=Styela clava TaxID=7725 RepID=UPI0019398063|nr:kinesin-like protein KIF6 [Styela clava]
MGLQTIQTFCRLRPTGEEDVKYIIHQPIKEDEAEDDKTSISSKSAPWEALDFHLPAHKVNPYSSPKEKKYSFLFRKVFDQDASQEEVFEITAKPVLDNVLSGYNGTIFTYGQTATGKTYTILGEEFETLDSTERGIMPRSICYLFDKLNVTKEEEGGHFEVQISYLEIYKDVGYDLLSGTREKRKVTKFDDLQQVISRTDAKNKLHLVHLSTHSAKTKEEALELFIRGSQNRILAETYVNDASSRSHCVFTILLRIKEEKESTKIQISKMNFVDLAGSERVGKTHNADRSLLAEARNINLSLHHLQQVIVALGKTESKVRRPKNKKFRHRDNDKHVHVPYRNTMITSVLRGSLGGNCLTSMVATVSVQNENIQETLSTCQFGQRVARIQNRAVINQSADLEAVVSRLEEENRRLRDKLREATSSKIEEPLTEEEMQTMFELVTEYLASEDGEKELEVVEGAKRIQFCYQRLKEYAVSGTKKKKRKGFFG